MSPTRIVVWGANGRMGQAVLRAALHRRDCQVAAALVRAQSGLSGEMPNKDIGPGADALSYSAALDPDIGADALIDFTGVHGFDAALALARERGLAFVSGSTGLNAEQMKALQAAAAHIPVLWASNFSLGVALLRRLATQAALALDESFDVEIVETHHRNKVDAPSGTALTLGRAIAEARRQHFDDVARYERVGQVGPRKPGEIGFAVLRAADVVGEHTVLFAAPGERIELTHRAGSREIFASGAVRAARWLTGQAPGCYDITDVLS